MEALVIFPHAQHGVDLLLPDLAPNRLPTAHGVESHDTSRQEGHAQQLGDGRGFRWTCRPPGRRSRARSCRQWARLGRRSAQMPPVPAPESPSIRAASCRARVRAVFQEDTQPFLVELAEERRHCGLPDEESHFASTSQGWGATRSTTGERSIPNGVNVCPVP